jgi:hypothetical protein
LKAIDNVLGCSDTDLRPTSGELTRIMTGLFEMLAAMDRAGVAHCDISTGNVLCRKGPAGKLEFKMVDFGLSTTEQESERGFWPAGQNMRFWLWQGRPIRKTKYSLEQNDVISACELARRVPLCGSSLPGARVRLSKFILYYY